MNVLWFTFFTQIVDGKYQSHFPSSRIRCLNLIGSMQHDVTVVPLNESAVPNALTAEALNISESVLANCDIAIFGKLAQSVLPLVDDLKRLGIPVILDVCDVMKEANYDYYCHLLQNADQVVASSPGVEEQLRIKGVQSVCIPDAQPGAPIPFSAPNESSVELLWYGMPANLVPMLDVIGDLAAHFGDRLKLTLLTNLSHELVIAQVPSYIERHNNGAEILLRQWTPESMEQGLADCDVVIIPSSEHAFHQAKTANRIMTAIWAGKSCVAYPLPSYREFADFVELNESMVEGVQTMLQHALKHRAKMVEDGQRYIAERHSVPVRARQWDQLIDQVLSRTENDQKLRLNLGCGDKILPGYINVDVVDERGGSEPDVLSDLRDLDVFEDDAADEILSVHVIEHFHYWEAHDVLKEWVRVLKPGGLMVVECPNLTTACQEILNNPDTAAMPGKEGQRSMWVLYGDPAWKDPLMCHKWLYTPQSLARLMMECGLVDVRQAPARFKLREPRDMRLVAIKPFKDPAQAG